MTAITYKQTSTNATTRHTKTTTNLKRPGKAQRKPSKTDSQQSTHQTQTDSQEHPMTNHMNVKRLPKTAQSSAYPGIRRDRCFGNCPEHIAAEQSPAQIDNKVAQYTQHNPSTSNKHNMHPVGQSLRQKCMQSTRHRKAAKNTAT